MNQLISTSIEDKLDDASEPSIITSHYTYDDLGRLINETNARGNSLEYYYNKNSRRTSTLLPLDSVHFWDASWNLTPKSVDVGLLETAYDSMSRPISVTDANGNTSEIFYNVFGQKVIERRADDSEIRYEYNQRGQVTDLYTRLLKDEDKSLLDGAGDTIAIRTHYDYDEFGRQAHIYQAKDTLNETHPENEYDHNGNIIKITKHYLDDSSRNQVTEFVYNNLNQLVETIQRGDANDPDRINKQEYDKRGLVVKVTEVRAWA